ncbi:MAG: hypothetical protein P4M11_02380 [Candidatus Pacebacteria bacterium]|nr:hypothetical protein [Candidatus Paceibacterota bacterium]
MVSKKGMKASSSEAALQKRIAELDALLSKVTHEKDALMLEINKLKSMILVSGERETGSEPREGLTDINDEMERELRMSMSKGKRYKRIKASREQSRVRGATKRPIESQAATTLPDDEMLLKQEDLLSRTPRVKQQQTELKEVLCDSEKKLAAELYTEQQENMLVLCWVR